MKQNEFKTKLTMSKVKQERKGKRENIMKEYSEKFVEIARGKIKKNEGNEKEM